MRLETKQNKKGKKTKRDNKDGEGGRGRKRKGFEKERLKMHHVLCVSKVRRIGHIRTEFQDECVIFSYAISSFFFGYHLQSWFSLIFSPRIETPVLRENGGQKRHEHDFDLPPPRAERGQRDGTEAVEGCTGSGTHGMDYCARP